MKIKLQYIALSTHLQHEIKRMFRISTQVFLPSVITTLLYFLIFGTVIGQRVGTIDGIPYTSYIAPGLVLIAVISNSYTNATASLYSARFQRSVEELLISPMRHGVFLLGYVLGGVFRGVVVALLVLLIAAFFIDFHWNQLPLTLLLITFFSCLFALAGFTNGILAKTFDDISIIPTFILSPLTYLGGVFYSIDMLPPMWRTISQLNPIYYIVDTLRYAMIGQSSAHLFPALLFIGCLVLSLTGLNLYLLNRGIGIRD